MSLLDDNVNVGDMDNLPKPLIPGPTNIELVDDVYTVGQVSTERWRSYIDCEKWDPKEFHDKLLAARAYHARICWETSCYISITNPDWISTGMIELIQETAHFELRKVEFKLISYQLTGGMMGLKTEDRTKMYHCAIGLFTTMIWIANKVLENGKKTKERRRLVVKMNEMRPYSCDGIGELGKGIDTLVFTICSFIKDQNFEQLRKMLNAAFVKELGQKLKISVLALDELLVVL